VVEEHNKWAVVVRHTVGRDRAIAVVQEADRRHQAAHKLVEADNPLVEEDNQQEDHKQEELHKDNSEERTY